MGRTIEICPDCGAQIDGDTGDQRGSESVLAVCYACDGIFVIRKTG